MPKTSLNSASCSPPSPDHTIEQPMKKRRAFLLTLLALLLVVGIPAGFLVRESFRFSGYVEVVSLVQAGKLRADSSGDILLPKQWARLTANGHVYQTYDKQAGLVILFPTAVDNYSVKWADGTIEQRRQIAGYVYCPGSLPSDGGFSFNGMDEVNTWDQEPVRPHWYYVEPFYS